MVLQTVRDDKVHEREVTQQIRKSVLERGPPSFSAAKDTAAAPTATNDATTSVDPRTPQHQALKTARTATPPSSEERQREEGIRPRIKKPRLDIQATIELQAHVQAAVDADAVTPTLSQLWAKPPAPFRAQFSFLAPPRSPSYPCCLQWSL